MYADLLTESLEKSLFPRAAALVVDANREDLYAFTGTLQRLGFEVRRFAGYSDALHSLKDETPDFAVVDQGTETFEGRLIVSRVLELNRRIPVVVTARKLNITCYLEAMQLGAVDYVQKPLTAYDLEQLVRTFWQPLRRALPARAQMPARLPGTDQARSGSEGGRR